MNPLRELARQMGLDARAIAERAQIPLEQVEAAMADAPAEPLATFLKLCGDLQVRFKLQAAPPFSFWFDVRAIDRLLWNNPWRKLAGLCVFPRNAAMLDKIIQTIRGRGASQSQAARYLNQHFIPNGSHSYVPWTTDYLAYRERKMRRKEINPNSPVYFAKNAWRVRWRRYVMSLILAEFFPVDPQAGPRYGLEVEYGQRYVTVRGTEKLPAAVRAWMMERLTALGWFAPGAWGLGEAPASFARVGGGGSPSPTPAALPR
jgi:hypothetical protein